MNNYFQSMTPEYANKYFPGGSVFEGAAKTLKRRGVIGIFFIGLFVAGGLLGLVFTISRALEYMAQGEDDVISVVIVLCAFFGLITLGFSALLIYLIKSIAKGRDGYIARSAKNSELSVSEIETFDQQAMASDCLILRLTEGLDRALSNSITKDGLLTRDYLYLADPAQIVFRVDSLRACCFTDYTYYVTTGNRNKKIHNLAIYLLASNGVSLRSDTTEEAGTALINLLLERNPAIDTNDGNILPENDEDSYKRRILQK